MRGRQVVLEQKSSRILLFYSLKGKTEKKKEISEKKMKNIVETELKVCVLSRMKIYIAARKASRQILPPSTTTLSSTYFYLIPVTQFPHSKFSFPHIFFSIFFCF